MKPGRMMPGGMNMQAMMKQAQKLQIPLIAARITAAVCILAISG